MSAEPEEARTLERFGDLCDRAAQYGLSVGLEFAVYTGVRTLAHAAQMVARSKRANTSVVVDALHFSRSGGLPAHIGTVDAGLFRYAQICDASADMPGPDRYAEPDPRGAHRAAPARRGRAAAPRAGGGAPGRDLRWPSRRPSRATADLPALERAQRAYRALSALLAS